MCVNCSQIYMCHTSKYVDRIIYKNWERVSIQEKVGKGIWEANKAYDKNRIKVQHFDSRRKELYDSQSPDSDKSFLFCL